jgi:hypothetical protein
MRARVAKWKVPTGMTAHVHQFDARAGADVAFCLRGHPHW